MPHGALPIRPAVACVIRACRHSAGRLQLQHPGAPLLLSPQRSCIRHSATAASPRAASSSPPLPPSASSPRKLDMSLVKQLREQSGAPITDCRDAVTQALTQASPSALSDSAILSSATDILRKKGISTASKKSGRVAAEGLVAVCIDSGRQRAALVEVNSETDFAARNERFQQTLQRVAAHRSAGGAQ